jgi:N,N'-diacetyllegionaminate synthase
MAAARRDREATLGAVNGGRFREYLSIGRCYIVAEAGSNHNGNLETAAELVEVAADAGVDAVKFQLFRAARMYPPGAGMADYLESGDEIFSLIESMEMPESWLSELAHLTAKRGLDLLVTPFDEASADAIEPFVPMFKVASYELTHHPLLRHIAAKGKPLILSTGASTLDEIGRALVVAREAGAADIVLLQCTAAYPARVEALNISAMDELRRFEVPVGFSDHSADPIIAPVAAVALGAAVVEKHFTLDRSLPGPDHRFAIEPDELKRLVSAVRDTELAVGNGCKDVHPDEVELRRFARRSVFAVQEIASGELLNTTNAAVLRSGKRDAGAPPELFERMLGKRAVRLLRANEPILEDDVG